MPGAAATAFDASAQLLACLTVAVQAAENPPKNVQFLPGNQAGEDISIYNDLCCEGTAYVRVSSMYPSFQDFPAPDSAAEPCQQQAMAVTYEVGIMRCAPVGTAAFVPTGAQWLAAHRQSMIDAQSIYKAICCFQGYYPMDAMLVGQWTPLGPLGACLLGTVAVTQQIGGCGGLC